MFSYYKSIGERAIEQVKDSDLNWQYNQESNSIATIVKHMWGNMRSRFTDFLTSDGEKEWRQREKEFDNDLRTRTEMMQKWEEGWDCVFKAVNALREEQLEEIVYIRNEGHTINEALTRQMTHYAYHVGQIVYLARMLVGTDWISLSVPRGQSEAFNQQKFSQSKSKKHFTE